MEDESQANASGSDQASTSQGGKVKQTRRRQRLSCVECTKRRQRCDRQFPCGLCTTRGIPHLCRWEPIVVRPTPQRPPTAAISAAANSTIETLSARIAALEQALLQQQQQNAARDTNDGTSHSSSMSPPASSENEGTPDLAHDFVSPPASLEAGAEDREGGEEPRGPIDFKVQAAAVALAQLSLAPRTEYVGNGTVLCAIHKLGDPGSWRLPHPATMLTSPVSPIAPETAGHDRRTWEILSELGGLDGLAGASPIRRLVAKLPPRAVFDEILDAFFPERSWQFGIPERWFRAGCHRMWDHIALRCVPGCHGEGGCPGCREEINPHWLCFVFAVLALAPSPGNSLKDSGRYFMCSIMARRYVEDVLLVTPAYSTSEGSVNGGILTCISSSLHCMYLVDRGRISEAWKLAGSALRHAQALGMHRDPSWRKWEQMNAIDRELRITGWWLLIISDRIWSFVLGRPMMAPRGSYDVMATPNDLHTDGTSNKCAAYHRVFIVLTDLVYEASEKCMGTRPPPYATVLDLDRRFREWENALPEPLRWKKSGTPGVVLPTPCDRALRYQSTTLAGWYMCALMGIHRPYLMHAPPVLAPPGSGAAGTQSKMLLNPSRERCIEIALELTKIMCDFHDDLAPWRAPGRLNAETFSYMLFDGAVALAGALSQVPPHPRAAECLTLLDRAMGALERHAEQAQGSRDGEGEMANRAMVVLRALRRAGGWDRKDEEKGELVSFQDLLMQARRQQPQSVQPPLSDSSTDFFPSLGAQMGGAQQYTTGTSMFEAPAPDAPGGSFMPFFNSSYPPVSSPSMFTNSQPANQGQARSFAAMGLSSDFEMSFTNARPAMDQMRPIQSMLMPFNVLQGVQPDSQQHMEDLDLDWARLAGMESWYSGTTSNE
ncbi:Zn(II)2Cys6 transcription factor [Phanerochaete sordida]|uniref:Zn(II)2Cys6 transcription factor n=1 Tax=Phanerochaete sordida TaxID=48140 RepID=A0A9P3LFR2_9APHY|nr:Zn(II)2Cys6 transcription factor [Phanerochaete sordida]